MRTHSIDRHKNLILVIVALLAPEIVGFQHLEWRTWESTHETFVVISYTWILEYSDWFSGIKTVLGGWLLQSDPFARIDLLLLSLMPLIPRFAFVVVVAFFRQGRIGKSIPIIAGILLLGLSIADCADLMMTNVIFGIPPGVYISITAPDVDTRLFLPIPILLITGLLLSKKPKMSDIGE